MKNPERKLQNLTTEDLVSRWDSLLPEYLNKLKEFKKYLLSVDKYRDELLLIREELEFRNVPVKDELEENEK